MGNEQKMIKYRRKRSVGSTAPADMGFQCLTAVQILVGKYFLYANFKPFPQKLSSTALNYNLWGIYIYFHFPILLNIRIGTLIQLYETDVLSAYPSIILKGHICSLYTQI